MSTDNTPKFKPITVSKAIPVTYDLGNLAAFDTNPLDSSLLNSENEEIKEEHIKSITRDNVQLLINQILSLPIKTTTDSVSSSNGSQTATVTLVSLPEPTTQLPREKPLPIAKPETKWEQFAKLKGIKKKEKSGKLVWSEERQEWAPKWGYKGLNKEVENQWLVEVDEENKKLKGKKRDGDELLDPRSLKRKERKELIKKNERQQKKNLSKK